MALQIKCASLLNYYLILLFVFVKLSLSENQPVINEESEISIQSGENFTVACVGDFEDLTWTLHPYNDIEYSSDTNYTITTNRLPAFSKHQYMSKLKIVNATYIDTGSYKCYSKSNPEYQSSMYLFVKDENHLSVYTDFKTAIGTVNNPHTIPCIPTSPDIRVILQYINEETSKIKLNVMDDDGTFTSFDNQKGFITNRTLVKGHFMYTCNFELNGKNESFEYLLQVEEIMLSINKPEIIDSSGGHTVVGMNLNLTCAIESAVQVFFEWTTPSGAIDNSRMIIALQENFGIIHQQSLLIKNARESDRGKYFCNVKDSQNHKAYSSIEVPVYKRTDHFLRLFEENKIKKVTEKVNTKYVQWRITVESHPVSTLEWFGPNNEKILENNSKYMTNFSAEHAFLRINDIQLNDFGKYTLFANNSIEKQSIEVFLNVTDRPSKLEIKKHAYYLIGEPCQMQCVATGNPVPTISWSYKNCLEPTKCNFVNITQNFSHIEQHGMHVVSNLTLKKCLSGYINCKASNSLGSEETNQALYISDVNNGFGIFGWDSSVYVTETSNSKTLTIAVGETLELTCGASRYDFKDVFNWFFNDKSLQNDNKYAFNRGDTDYSYRSNLKVESMEFTDGGSYVCRTENKKTKKQIEETIIVRVKKTSAPYLNETNMKNLIEMEYPKKLQLFCKISGMPKPKITWYKNEKVLHQGGKLTFTDSEQILNLNSTDLNDEGHYKCMASNKVGTVSKITNVNFTNKKSNEFNKYGIAAIVVLCTFVVICLIILCIKIRNEKKLQRELQIAGLANFEKGALENINPDLGLDDQADLLPYDKKWEFPIEKLKLGRQLGSGAFGVVMRGEAKDICEDEETTTVAVKTVKRNADSTYIKALASELKIMVHLGKHLNVVNLLGAVTKNVGKRELMVIVEFCRFGNLQNYILRHRETFINQVDPRSGDVDYNIGLEELSRSYSISSNNSGPRSPLKYAALSFSSNSRKIPENMTDYRSDNYVSNSANTGTTMVYMAPSGSTDEEGVVMSNNSVQPEWRSNYRGDYKGDVKPICTKDLLAWSFQVARGMEYLASRKVLHGDLAARNILLADNNIVKICDFGLAKSMYNNDNYKKKGDGPLPVKWMAVESIRDRVFSTQSDVWSFGIVLWEFFSLAHIPYPGMEADERLYQKLAEGYRMEPPENTPNAIVKMMSDCWLAKPLLRPSFTKLSERLGLMLEDSVKKYYIDLNDPYLLMNTQRLEDGRSDYLAMFSPPNFENLSSPHNYANNSSPLTSPELTPGYLCMQQKNIFSPRADDSSNEVFDFNNVPKNNKNSAEAQGTELVPMLHPASESDCDSSVCSSPSLALNSFSNPSYHIPPNVQQKDDIKCLNNYINMAQNKTAMKDKIIDNSIKTDQKKNMNDYVNSSVLDWESVNV